MSRYDDGGGFPAYVPVAERRARAAQAVERLKKTNPHTHPVVVSGRALATTWWGKAWNKNLERYADFANRIGRGRSYVRHGAVLDLSLNGGLATALVQGSQRKPYHVEVAIDPLKAKIWSTIITASQGQITSLSDLVEGQFPKSLATLFSDHGGLFPTPEEIHMRCSCPDWATLCKHVAAVLYGIGARLDEDPTLFFLLREVTVNDLISQAVTEKANTLLKKSQSKSERAIDAEDHEDLGALFGIDLDDDGQ